MLSEKDMSVADYAIKDIRRVCFEESSIGDVETGEELIRNVCNGMLSRGATIDEVDEILINNGFHMEFKVTKVDDLTMQRAKKGLI
ncbi:hypothetical protein [Bacillus cereus]|uniref:hypothetical protein n=1 Tax=Bacillus cereus TaxID=1396 RepID=UPI00398151B1